MRTRRVGGIRQCGLALLLCLDAAHSLTCPGKHQTSTADPLVLSACSTLSSLVSEATRTGGSTDITIYVTFPASTDSGQTSSSTWTWTMTPSTAETTSSSAETASRSPGTRPSSPTPTAVSKTHSRSAPSRSGHRTHRGPARSSAPRSSTVRHTKPTSDPANHHRTSHTSGMGSHTSPGQKSTETGTAVAGQATGRNSMDSKGRGSYTDGVVIPIAVVCTVIPVALLAFLIWYCCKRKRNHRERYGNQSSASSNVYPSTQVFSAAGSSTTAVTNTKPTPSPGSYNKLLTPLSPTPPQILPTFDAEKNAPVQALQMSGASSVPSHTPAVMSVPPTPPLPPPGPGPGQSTLPGTLFPARKPVPVQDADSASANEPTTDPTQVALAEQDSNTLTALPKAPPPSSNTVRETPPWLSQPLRAFRRSKGEETGRPKRDSDEVRGVSGVPSLPESNMRASTVTHETHASQSSTSTAILNSGTWFAPSIPPSLQEQSESGEVPRTSRRVSSSWLSLASRRSDSNSTVTPPATAVSTRAVSTYSSATPKIEGGSNTPKRAFSGSVTPRIPDTPFPAPPTPTSHLSVGPSSLPPSRPASRPSTGPPSRTPSQPYSPRNFSFPRRRPPKSPASPPPSTPPPAPPPFLPPIQSGGEGYFWDETDK